MLLFLYLTLAILTDMQTVTLATELFVGSESSANLAVPFFFVCFLHHPVLSQLVVDTFRGVYPSAH